MEFVPVLEVSEGEMKLSCHNQTIGSTRRLNHQVAVVEVDSGDGGMIKSIHWSQYDINM